MRKTPLLLAASLSIKLWWTVAIAPAVIRLQITCDAIDSDRWVSVAIDGPNFYRGSGWSIEGRAAPKRTPYWDVVGVPAGTYIVTAAIGSSEDNERVRVQRTIEVSE